MVCKTCGSQLTENDKFCRYCGATVEAAPADIPQQPQRTYIPTPQSAYAPPRAPQPERAYTPQPERAYAPQPERTYTPQPERAYAPQPQAAYPPRQAAPQQPRKGAHLKPSGSKKGGKKGLIIGGSIVAALLVIVLAVGLIVLNTPTLQVGNAFKNTADTFARMGEVWHSEEVAAFGEKEALSISTDIQLDTVGADMMYEIVGYYYYGDEEVAAFCDAVSGLGIRMDMDMDLENREMGLLTSVHSGSADLLTAIVSAEDEMIYLGLPDFLDDFYGIDTETFMRDLEAMGADVGEASQISFNIFELIEIMKKHQPDPKALEADFSEAVKSMVDDIGIEKAGKKTLSVGGESLKCKAYTVTIPQDALEELLDAIVDNSEVDTVAMMTELYQAMGLPDYVIEELLYEMGNSISEPDYSDLYEALDMLEDIELEVYVKSGKIAGIAYEKKIDGSKLEIAVSIGGDHYGDLIELEIKADGEKFTLEFEGDHTAREGVFTDKATFKLGGEKLTMNTEYDPKSGDLSVKLGDDGLSFRLEGIYMADADRYTMDIDEVSIAAGGEELISFSLFYEVTGYEKRVRVSDAKLLTDMDQEDIMTIAGEAEGNAMEWALTIAASYPELLELADAF